MTPSRPIAGHLLHGVRVPVVQVAAEVLEQDERHRAIATAGVAVRILEAVGGTHDFFDLPELPESVVRGDHWRFFRHFLRDADPAYTPEEIDRYVEAWSQPGAVTGMINYYRSSVRTPPKKAEAALRPVQAPTLVIWGQRDRYLGEELAEPDHDDVPNLDRVERLPDASHWVHHDEAERVSQVLTDFFAPALASQN